MTPAENMYISMKCSVCTISYTVINIDKKKSENDVLSSRSIIHGQVINLPTTLKLIGEALAKVRSPMPPTYFNIISLCILV